MPRLEHRHKKHLSIILLVSSILLVACIGLLFIYGKNITNYINPSAQTKIKAIVQDTIAEKYDKTIRSDLGMAITYNSQTHIAHGQVLDKVQKPGMVTGEEYDGTDLDTRRAYAMITIDPIAATSPKGEYDYISHPGMRLSTNHHQNYFDKSKLEQKYQALTPIELLVARQKETIAKNGDTVQSDKMIKIGSVDYREILAVHTYDLLGSTTSSYSYYLMTVQNDRPYWISFTDSFVDQTLDEYQSYMKLIASVSYSKPLDSAYAESSVVSAGISTMAVTSFDLASTNTVNPTKNAASDTANVPDVLNSQTFVPVVAHNQPATVRIGVFSCTDLTLRADNGASFSVKHLCGVPVIGSGSFISSDGYIATNGHVVYTVQLDVLLYGLSYIDDPSVLNNYFKYAVQAGYATQDQINDTMAKAKAGDKQARQALILIGSRTPLTGVLRTNTERHIVVQTSDTPLKFNIDSSSWTYDKTRIKASLVDYDFDESSMTFNASSSHSDVAIIKAEGDFPVVSLGTASDIGQGEEVTAIGYPAFVDDGLGTKSVKTYPSITQGEVLEIKQNGDAGGHTLLITSARIASGNSGGPAFNKKGVQVGLNTYGATIQGCSRNGETCFTNGYVRDANDLRNLLSKNNISLKTDGSVASLWQQGLDQFGAGRYSEASKTFSSLQAKYNDNYFINKFAEVAKSQTSDESGASAFNLSSPLMIILVIVASLFALIMVIAGALLVFVHARRSPQPLAAGSAFPAPMTAAIHPDSVQQTLDRHD